MVSCTSVLWWPDEAMIDERSHPVFLLTADVMLRDGGLMIGETSPVQVAWVTFWRIQAQERGRKCGEQQNDRRTGSRAKNQMLQENTGDDRTKKGEDALDRSVCLLFLVSKLNKR